MTDFSQWAQRRSGRGQRPAEEPRQPSQQQAAPTLPLPPSGYAWGRHPNDGYILIPLPTAAAPTTAPVLVSPPRQPSGLHPFVQQPITSQFPTGHATPRVETCALVKPADKDPYAELLAQIPDLVPDNGGYDAMAGNPSPLTVQEAGQCQEFLTTQDGHPMRAFPDGAMLVHGSAPLKGATG